MVQLIVGLALLSGNPAALVRRIPLSEFPFQPVTGLAKEGNRWLVGGLRGLALGRPGGEWKMASDQAVKQILSIKGMSWVLYGNGSVDKVDITHNRLYFDVLSGRKRPWVGSISVGPSGLVCGGYGGWIEKGATVTEETYLPVLEGYPVTAICQEDEGVNYVALPGDLQTPSSQVMAMPISRIWIGTQDGLYLAKAGTVTRIGLAAGLPDLWITSLVPSGDSMIVGMKAGGLAIVRGSTAVPLAAPSKRVENLLRWRGHLVMGSLDGAWIREGDEWKQVATEETTFLTEVRGELVVGGAEEVRFFRLVRGQVSSLKSQVSSPMPRYSTALIAKGPGSRCGEGGDAFDYFHVWLDPYEYHIDEPHFRRGSFDPTHPNRD